MSRISSSAFSRVLLPLVVTGAAFVTGAIIVACDGDDTVPNNGGVDANVALDTGATADSGDLDSATEEDAPSPVDSGIDAPSTADAADAAPPLNALFAHIGGKLVSIDVTTGALTEVGATGQTYLVMAWDATAKVARVVLDPYSTQNGVALPKLGTLNLCTGVTTASGVVATLGGAQVRRQEALAQEPSTGTWYTTYGATGTGVANEFLSQANGKLDIATGIITESGKHQTLQDDGDQLLFINGVLHLMDIAQTSSGGTIYTINQTTGAATKVSDPGPNVLRLAFDPTRNVTFALKGTVSNTARSVGTINIATGVVTVIGSNLPDTTYPGQQFVSLLSAPAPICP